MKHILLSLVLLSFSACEKAAESSAVPISLSEGELMKLAQKSLSENMVGYPDAFTSARLSDDKKRVLLILKKKILGQKETVLEYDGFRRYIGRIRNGNSSVGPIIIDLDKI